MLFRKCSRVRVKREEIKISPKYAFVKRKLIELCQRENWSGHITEVHYYVKAKPGYSAIVWMTLYVKVMFWKWPWSLCLQRVARISPHNSSVSPKDIMWLWRVWWCVLEAHGINAMASGTESIRLCLNDLLNNHFFRQTTFYVPICFCFLLLKTVHIDLKLCWSSGAYLISEVSYDHR